MTGHKIVPIKATEEMLQCSYKIVSLNAKERGGFLYEKMLAAAPRYEITDAEVERLARIGCESDDSECVGPDCACWDSRVREISAALEAFRDGLEGR